MNSVFKKLIIFSFPMLLIGTSALSATQQPLKTALPEWSKEPVVHVKTARVLLANYPLIRRDFPQFRDLPESENRVIDEWLIKSAAFISVPQANQKTVNSEIVTDGTGHARRPEAYNRALIFEVEGGLIDAKGNGSLNPRQQGHGNGLATLGETIREFLYEKLVAAIMERENLSVETSGNYAVIDWGFDVVNADGNAERAGSILRQGGLRAQRDGDLNFFLDPGETKIIEAALRKYGVTAAGDAWNKSPYDAVNIQGTANGTLIDFGSYLTVRDFTREVRDYGGRHLLFSPGSPDFPKIDESARVPYDVWGAAESGKDDPRFDNAWIYAHRTAIAVAGGRTDRAGVEAHVENMFRVLNESWREHPLHDLPDRYFEYRFQKMLSSKKSTIHTREALTVIVKQVMLHHSTPEILQLLEHAQTMDPSWGRDWIEKKYMGLLLQALQRNVSASYYANYLLHVLTTKENGSEIKQAVLRKIVDDPMLAQNWAPLRSYFRDRQISAMQLLQNPYGSVFSALNSKLSGLNSQLRSYLPPMDGGASSLLPAAEFKRTSEKLDCELLF